jgi:hypothetical protein
MEVKIEGNMLVIKIPMQKPALSVSGKTLVVASTHGNQKTSAVVNGQAVTVGLNAYIYARPRQGQVVEDFA